MNIFTSGLRSSLGEWGWWGGLGVGSVGQVLVEVVLVLVAEGGVVGVVLGLLDARDARDGVRGADAPRRLVLPLVVRRGLLPQTPRVLQLVQLAIAQQPHLVKRAFMHGVGHAAFGAVSDDHEGLVRDLVVVDLLHDHYLVRLERASALREPVRR